MDDARFDVLTKIMVRSGHSRRGVLRMLGEAAGVALLGGGAADLEAKRKKKKKKSVRCPEGQKTCRVTLSRTVCIPNDSCCGGPTSSVVECGQPEFCNDAGCFFERLSCVDHQCGTCQSENCCERRSEGIRCGSKCVSNTCRLQIGCEEPVWTGGRTVCGGGAEPECEYTGPDLPAC